jgi:hypothetical protein
MSIVVREDLLLEAIEETCKALLNADAQKSYRMRRGKCAAILFVEKETAEGNEVSIFLSGDFISQYVRFDDPIIVDDPARGATVRVFDVLSKVPHSVQAYILGDLLAVEESLSR